MDALIGLRPCMTDLDLCLPCQLNLSLTRRCKLDIVPFVTRISTGHLLAGPSRFLGHSTQQLCFATYAHH